MASVCHCRPRQDRSSRAPNRPQASRGFGISSQSSACRSSPPSRTSSRRSHRSRRSTMRLVIRFYRISPLSLIPPREGIASPCSAFCPLFSSPNTCMLHTNEKLNTCDAALFERTAHAEFAACRVEGCGRLDFLTIDRDLERATRHRSEMSVVRTSPCVLDRSDPACFTEASLRVTRERATW